MDTTLRTLLLSGALLALPACIEPPAQGDAVRAEDAPVAALLPGGEY